MIYFKRVLECILELLVALDQALQVIVCSPFYIILGEDRPNCDETLSSRIGRYSKMGYWSARVLEVFVDSIFWCLGKGWGHCRRMIGH